MDVNQENIEWMIFELLEGNLDPKDSAELRQAIQKNSGWQSLFQTYEKTYLAKETIEFPNKKSLHKSALLKVSWIQKSIAAASVLLLLSAGWYFKVSLTNNPIPKVAADNHLQPLKEKTETPRVNKKVEKEELNTEQKVVIHVSNHKKPVKISSVKQTVAEVNKDNSNLKQDSVQTLVLAERDFWQQMLSNKYLTDEEKIEKLIKWRNINRGSSEPIFNQEENPNINTQNPEIKMVFTNNSNLPIHSENTTEQWLKNQIEQVRNFRIPQVHLSTRRRQNSAIPGITIKLKMQNQ